MRHRNLRYFLRIFKKQNDPSHSQASKQVFSYKPTTYLSHPFLQSIYNLYEPKVQIDMKKQKIFFEDGGHISIDWGEKNHKQQNPPILFIMHGLTGGSQGNYIRVMVEQATKEGYQCVCLNSRGINNEMTSPIPFTGIQHHQLETALDRVELHYPNSPIYMIGTSFGGNYLLRYLLKKKRQTIKGLVTLAPPMSIKKVIDDMPAIYQQFFVKRYINDTIKRHPQMKYWEKIGLVNLNEVYKSKNLTQYYTKCIAQMLGAKTADQVFAHYQITEEQIEKLDIDTLFIMSKDDPIVSYNSMPVESIKKNKKIKFVTTQKGGHLCWFEGTIPKRWYPKPILDYLKTLSK